MTIPDSGILTVDEAVRRMGFDAAGLRDPGRRRIGAGLRLYQAGVVTLYWSFPSPEHKKATDRLGGEGFRHWYVAADVNVGVSMYARHGNAEGSLEYPEPPGIPFTSWTELLGPSAA